MIETYHRLVLRDKEGRVVRDTGKVRCRSYVLQFLQLLEGFFSNVTISAKDIAGASTTIHNRLNQGNFYGRTDAGAGVDTHGVLVGTNVGATPESNDNFKIDTQILHSGIGEAGKLNYQATTFVAPRVVGANIDLDVSRAFINETAGTITVKEIVIYCKNTADTKYHLLLRDVVADQAVLSGQTLTVVYTLRTTA